MEDLVIVEYWVQDTAEAGHWERSAEIPRKIAEGLIYGDHGPELEQGIIIEIPKNPQWPFPTKDNPLKPWTPSQVKEYNDKRTEESPL